MKLLVYGILTIVLALGALRLLSRKLLYFPQPLPPARQTVLDALVPAVRPLTLTATDGTRLAGWCIEKDVKDLPFVFYFGGNAEEVSLNIENFLAHVPANVVLVNYRGFGHSNGRPTEARLKRDSLEVFDTLVDKYNPSACLAWGRSLGSSIACYLAAQRQLDGLILTCPFDSIAAVAAGIYPAWLVKQVLTDPHRTVDFAGAIVCPALILAAEEDEVISFERTKALVQKLTCPTQLEVIPRTGHNTISEARGYYGLVQAFIETVTARKEASG